MLDPTWTVHQLITRYPRTADIFAQFGIHTCCGGNAPLIEAAHRDGVDVNALVAAVRAVVEDAPDHAAEAPRVVTRSSRRVDGALMKWHSVGPEVIS